MEEEELRKAFDARDLDRDGLLRYPLPSFSDLEESTGLSIPELRSVFAACQGSQGNGAYLTFQEFAAGFRQFPREAGSPSPKRAGLKIEVEEAATEPSLEDTSEIAKLLTSCQQLFLALGHTATPHTNASIALHALSSTLTTPGTKLPQTPDFSSNLASLLTAASSILQAQSQELGKMRELLDEEASWNEAILREHEIAKNTCRLLTEKTREFEVEWRCSTAHSESQKEHLQRELDALRFEGKQNSAKMDDVQSLLQEKDVQISELQRELRMLSRRREVLAQPKTSIEPKEDAPSPRMPRTSRTALKFLFSPLPSPTKSHSFQDSLRQRQLAALREREKAVEIKEQKLYEKEKDLEEAIVKKCSKFQRENEEIRQQLLRERIKSEQYKVMARESPSTMEGWLGDSLSQEIEKVCPREQSPIRVKIVPKRKKVGKKRGCWLFE